MTHVVQKCSIVKQPNTCINLEIEEHKHFSFKGKVNEFEMHNLTIKTSEPTLKVHIDPSQQRKAKGDGGSMMLWPEQQNLREALLLFKGFLLFMQLKYPTSSMKSSLSLTPSLPTIRATLSFPCNLPALWYTLHPVTHDNLVHFCLHVCISTSLQALGGQGLILWCVSPSPYLRTCYIVGA